MSYLLVYCSCISCKSYLREKIPIPSVDVGNNLNWLTPRERERLKEREKECEREIWRENARESANVQACICAVAINILIDGKNTVDEENEERTREREIQEDAADQLAQQGHNKENK